MNNKPIKLFSASAGAGKTYTLTLEYIKLALQEVESRGYFRRILAVTFTNKAAEEMKKRIIDFLYLIAKNDHLKISNPQKFRESNQIIDRILSDYKNDKKNIDKIELIQRANQALKQILQDYGLFSVMTIDAFVQKLSQSFIEELNLPDQFEVNLDSKQLLNELMDDILDKINLIPNSILKQAILNFSMNEVDEDRSWNQLRESLQKFLLILFEEEYIEKEFLINQFDLEDFLTIEKQINAFSHHSIEKLIEYSKNIIQLIESHNLEEADFTQGSNGPVADFHKYIRNPQLNGNNYSYMNKAIQSGIWTASKTTLDKKNIIEEISNDLTNFANHFFQLYQFASQKNQLLHLIKKNLRKLALLKLIQKELNLFQLENGIVSISEFSKKINQIVSHDPIPFIYEKMGEKYNHILIDEFQDTSLLQWKNFMPLLENASSFMYTNLIVGDAKQSIYKFRGGEVGLIAALFSSELSYVEKKISIDSIDYQRFSSINENVSVFNLGENYRSSRAIVNFNNDLFQWIHEKSNVGVSFPLINQVYGNFVTQLPQSNVSASNISCFFYSVNKEKPYNRQNEKEWVLSKVLDIINESKKRKYKFKDIAILCRGNKEANYLALELKNLGIPLTSSDSLLIHYSSAIKIINSFLGLLVNRNNKIKQFEVQSNLQFLKNLTFEEAYQLIYKTLDCIFENDLIDAKKCVYQLIEQFDLFSYQDEISYLLKYLDILDDFCSRKSNSIDEFLNYFDQNKNLIAINGNDQLDAITISTIHKSKGLEYPIVILGFATWSLYPTKGEKWYDFSTLKEVDELIINERKLNTHYLPIISKAYDGFKDIESQREEEIQTSTLEALNMLYVACTRAKYDLYIISKNVSEDSPKKIFTEYDESIAKILFNFCLSSEIENNNLEEYLEFTFSKNSLIHSNIEPKINIQSKIFKAERHLESSLELRNSRSFNEQFSDSIQKREWGNSVHELIAKNNLEDIKEKIIVLKNGLDPLFTEYLNNFNDFLSNPDNYFLFNLDLSILIEQDIITEDGVIYRPDRIIKLKNEFVVIDYKTGKSNDKHKVQVENYKNLLINLGFLPVKGKLVYFEENKVVDV